MPAPYCLNPPPLKWLRQRCFDVFPFLYLFFLHRHFRDKIFVCQCSPDDFKQCFINRFIVWKTKFHLCRVYVDIQQIRIHRKVQNTKRILVLHQKSLICFFNWLWEQCTLYITSIDKIIFKITVSTGNYGFPDKSFEMKIFVFMIDFQKTGGDIPAIDMIDHIFFPGIAGSMHFCLPVIDKFKGNIRMWQSKPFHQIVDVIALCLCGL